MRGLQNDGLDALIRQCGAVRGDAADHAECGGGAQRMLLLRSIRARAGKFARDISVNCRDPVSDLTAVRGLQVAVFLSVEPAGVAVIQCGGDYASQNRVKTIVMSSK